MNNSVLSEKYAKQFISRQGTEKGPQIALTLLSRMRVYTYSLHLSPSMWMPSSQSAPKPHPRPQQVVAESKLFDKK